MKRSKSINLDFMRKVPRKGFMFNTLALGVAVALTGCSQSEQVRVVESVEDCQTSTDLTIEQCEAAYQKAVLEAERTGPKYNNARSCEAEFGYDQCHRTSSGFFTPFMTGYLVSSMIGNIGRQAYNPVYTYNRPYSNYHNKVMTADGSILGRAGRTSYKVNKSMVSKRKPTVSRTVSRGGFGSVASAKSSWGGGSKSSWGG
ncbi:MAG: DUF1190 domain-containing protein [Bermanella sp.]